MSVDIPSAYGGSGQSFFASILVIEEMSKVDPSVGSVIDGQNALMNRLFLNYGTEEQKRHYLPQMTKHLVLFYF
jgi:alkylation response protein AidB-like acyl-CoA dehydrogenase